MMKLTSFGVAALVASLLVLGGCDQVEKSTEKLMGKATESAKQAIDDTQKAAGEALSDATGGVINLNPKKEKKEEPEADDKSSQEI